jgi:hypothetical protein
VGGRGKHGPPHTLRCSRCKACRRIGETVSCSNLSATGRTRVVGTYGRRHHVTLYEIKHTTCGHVMWSNHHDARRLHERVFGPPLIDPNPA